VIAGAEPIVQYLDEKRLFRKIELKIIPFIFITFIIAFLDRINIGFAQVQMQVDLGFNDAIYGLAAGIYFLGYFFFEVPSNLFLQRVGAKITFMRIMILWGITSVCMAFVRTPTQLYVVRFFLGVFEAGFFPGIVLYLSYWFPSTRRAGVVSWMIVGSAVSGVVGGIASGYIMHYMNGMLSLPGWQWMFIVEGGPAVVLGVLAYWAIEDRPVAATWLTDSEKRTLTTILEAEYEAKQTTSSHSLLQALRDRRLYALSAIYFAATCGPIAIAFWLPAMIKTAGASGSMQVGLYSAIPYIIGVVGIIYLTKHSDARKERRGHYAFCTIGAAVALLTLPHIAGHLVAILLALGLAVALTFSLIPIFWAVPPDYLSGTAAAGGIAVISSIGQLGSFSGPTMIGWIKMSTGSVNNGLYFLALMLLLSGAGMTWLLRHDNRYGKKVSPLSSTT